MELSKSGEIYLQSIRIHDIKLSILHTMLMISNFNSYMLLTTLIILSTSVIDINTASTDDISTIKKNVLISNILRVMVLILIIIHIGIIFWTQRV